MSKLPSLTTRLPNDLRRFLDRVRETLTGAGLDSLITRRDLANAGIINPNPTGPVEPADPVDGCETPPAPTGLVAEGGFSAIYLYWDALSFTCKAYTEVWAAEEDNLSAAVLVGTSRSNMFAHFVGGGQGRYYWIRYVNTAEVAGPYNDAAGTYAETALDPEYMLELLTGQLTESQLYQSLVERINLIDAPSTVIGSVDYRVHQEELARLDGLAQEALYRETAINQEVLLRTEGDDQLSGLITALTATVGENTAAIVDEQTARASADSAEALSRELLAAQLRGDYDGNDLTEVVSGFIATERNLRLTADQALATSISALSVGISEGMDPIAVWYFDNNSYGGWDGDGTCLLDSDNGYLTQIIHQVPNPVDVRIHNALDQPFDGAIYNNVRFRVRRDSGTAGSWGFRVDYRVGTIWYTGPVPTFESVTAGNFATVDVDMSEEPNWTGSQIEAIRIYTSAAADDLWSFDFISIGRIGPAASTASVLELEQAMVTADSALAIEINQLTATVGDNTSLILTERQARIDEDGALASRIDALDVRVGDNAASIASEAIARADADEALTSLVTVMRADVDSNVAAISQEATTRATADEAITTRIDLVVSRVDGNQAAIVVEELARTTADSALTTRIDALLADVGDNSALIIAEQVARADGDTALAQTIQQVSTTVSGNTASIQVQQESIDGLYAEYTVKLDVNGYISGFGLAGTAQSSEFIVLADSFYIAAPQIPGAGSDVYTPFVVITTTQIINGEIVPPGVYMDSAYIINGTIKSAQIQSLVADKITAGVIRGLTIEGSVIWGTDFYLGGTPVKDINGLILGVNDPDVALVGNDALFNSNVFKIQDGLGGGVPPFEVSGGIVRIREAMIQDGTITSLKVEELLRSTNWDGWLPGEPLFPETYMGTKGCAIHMPSGMAVFHGVYVRGDIEATSLRSDLLIVGDNIGEGAVTGAHIADATITSANIGFAEITRTHIVDAAIDAAKIEDLTVTALHIAPDALTTIYNYGDIMGGAVSQGCIGHITTPDWGTGDGGKALFMADFIIHQSAPLGDPTSSSWTIELWVNNVKRKTIRATAWSDSGTKYVHCSLQWKGTLLLGANQFSIKMPVRGAYCEAYLNMLRFVR